MSGWGKKIFFWWTIYIHKNGCYYECMVYRHPVSHEVDNVRAENTYMIFFSLITAYDFFFGYRRVCKLSKTFFLFHVTIAIVVIVKWRNYPRHSAHDHGAKYTRRTCHLFTTWKVLSWKFLFPGKKKVHMLLCHLCVCVTCMRFDVSR